MNKNIKEKKKLFNIIPLLLILVMLSMTIGYGALQQTLFIQGNATISTPEYKIIIKSIEVKENTDGAYQNATPTFENTEGAVYSELSNTSSSITYNVEIKNMGLTSGVLDYIFVSQDNANMKYKIGGINTGDIIEAGKTTVATITIEYWDNVTDATSSTVSTLFNFEFLKHEANYSNDCTLVWDGASVSEPIVRNVYSVDYYQISDANELSWFANTVNSGNNTINAILTNDICLNSKAFTTIGTTSYNGIFDGQNRTIKDYNYTKEYEVNDNATNNLGMFLNNAGTIKNTNFVGTISEINTAYTAAIGDSDEDIIANTSNIGGVVVNNTGKIQNVSFSGTVYLSATAKVNCTYRQAHTHNYVGGIAANNSGIITGSYNKATFTLKGMTDRVTCNIYTRSANIYSGGISGNNTGYISDSYNTANMSIEGTHEKNASRTSYTGIMGGVAGINTNMVKNSYNSGTLTQTLPEENYNDSQTGVIARNSGTLTNVYYQEGTGSNTVGTSATAADMKDLNLEVESFLGNYFKTDTTNINGYYPILKWQTK